MPSWVVIVFIVCAPGWAEEVLREGVPAAAAIAGSAAAATAVAPASSMSRRRADATASVCSGCIWTPEVCGGEAARDGGSVAAGRGHPARQPSGMRRRASMGARGRTKAVGSVSRRDARRTEIRLNFLESRGAASGFAALQKN
ncbi:hypothetical protein [Burkholderia sp. BCC0419]|uniref:hypothetical protein n=1 Tax=Burkholderia sp. BCC0419 TaxID=486878 RepID=UPI001FC83CEA|nr:hypothetical protein [Burkholderia sp. BCC0419]